MRMIESSRQAPFGKGKETIVDTSVRNTWEMDASRISFEHPSWRTCQNAIFNRVCQDLGIPGGGQHAKGQLYKLLIYQPGAMFKPHTDTEKAPRMFGTMVICLPCMHEGGDLVVTFNGNKKRYSSAGSKWSSMFAAWYANVVHEVEPIRSGYRVALTYNLVHKGSSSIPRLPDTTKQQTLLQSIMRDWHAAWEASKDWAPAQLVWPLEHQYTEANLRVDHLKLRDRARVEAILGAGGEHDFEYYLCIIEKSLSGPVKEWDPTNVMYLDGTPSDIGDGYDDHHSLDYVEGEEFGAKHAVDLDGHVLNDKPDVDEDDFIVPYETDTRDPDEGEFGGWTGNEGTETTHWFRDAVLLMMPRERDDSSNSSSAMNSPEVMSNPPETVHTTGKRKKPRDSGSVAQATKRSRGLDAVG